MKIIITGRKVNLRDSFKERVHRKLEKFSRFFDDEAQAQVVVNVENERETVEVTISSSGMIYRAEETAYDMFDALEKVCDVLMRKINENKSRLEYRMKAGAFDNIQPENHERPEEDKEKFKIVRNKRFEMKPMSVEEAILQMKLLGHMFYVFFNMDTESINVVYQRKDGNYGLIETVME
ncbi:MAG TPA: ribosome-associated translation inhibitor RaiA [Clostridiales bacterium]|nr:ribosome-associated translation inhibitor RaiA [Clostridiales bacterium]